MSPSPSNNTLSQQALVAQEDLSRAIATRTDNDIATAVKRWSRLSVLTSSAHPDLEAVLASYSVALILRWDQHSDIRDLDAAIQILEDALEMTPHDQRTSRNRYQNLVNLGASLLDRWERTLKDPTDIRRAQHKLEEATAIGKQLGEHSSEHHLRAALGHAYLALYDKRIEGSSALEDAAANFSKALTSTPIADRGILFKQLGATYYRLYDRRGDKESLNRATDYYEQAMKASLDGTDMKEVLNRTAKCHAIMFNKTRNKAHLDRELEILRRMAGDNQNDGNCMRSVGNTLYYRWKQLSDRSALDEAIESYELALYLYGMTPDGEQLPGSNADYHSLPSFYFSFGTALIRRFSEDRTLDTKRVTPRQLQDIERAVKLLEKAVLRAGTKELGAYEERLKSAMDKLDWAKKASRKNSSGKNPVITSPQIPNGKKPTIAWPQSPNGSAHTTNGRPNLFMSIPSTPVESPVSTISRAGKTPTIPPSSPSDGTPVGTPVAELPKTLPKVERRSSWKTALTPSVNSIMSVPMASAIPPSKSQQNLHRPRVLRRSSRSGHGPTAVTRQTQLEGGRSSIDQGAMSPRSQVDVRDVTRVLEQDYSEPDGYYGTSKR